MRWLKYGAICIVSLVIFIGGAVGSQFIGEMKDMLRIGEKSTYALNITSQMTFPYNTYKSTITFSAKHTQAQAQVLESSLAGVYDKMIHKLGQANLESVCIPNNRSLLLSRTKTLSSTQESIIIHNALACTITKQNFQAFKTLLTELDYLALKSGIIEIHITAPIPTIPLEQTERIAKELRTALLQKAQDSVSFVADSTKQKCYFTSLKERRVQIPRAKNPQSALGLSIADKEPSTSLEYIQLPSDTSGEAVAEARVVFECR